MELMGRRAGYGTGRWIRGLLAAILAALIFSGCVDSLSGKSKEENLAMMEEDLIVVGVSQIGSESVWRTANTSSIQETFTKENGYVLIFKNARQKQENQIKALRSFISQRVDYIVFSPITESGWDTVLQEAKEAGIPVILIDRKVKISDDSLYVSWIGSDFVNEGRMAGETLERCLREQKRLNDSIHIVVLQGTEGSTSSIGRTKGFASVAEQHKNWNILEQVDAEFTTAKGKEEMERLLRKYERIDVLISQNDDMTFGALEAIRQAGISVGTEKDMIIISFDAVKNALKLVEQGMITADVECNPNQGMYAEQVIRKLENQEAVAKLYFVPERVFTRENVSQRLEEMGE